MCKNYLVGRQWKWNSRQTDGISHLLFITFVMGRICTWYVWWGILSVLTLSPSQCLVKQPLWPWRRLKVWGMYFLNTVGLMAGFHWNKSNGATSVNPPQRQNYLRRRPTYKHNEILRRHLGFSLSSGFSLFPTHPLSLINYDIKWWLRNSVSKLRSKRAKRKEHENTCEHYWLCS